jgi:hypothetical protein
LSFIFNNVNDQILDLHSAKNDLDSAKNFLSGDPIFVFVSNPATWRCLHCQYHKSACRNQRRGDYRLRKTEVATQQQLEALDR